MDTPYKEIISCDYFAIVRDFPLNTCCSSEWKWSSLSATLADRVLKRARLKSIFNLNVPTAMCSLVSTVEKSLLEKNMRVSFIDNYFMIVYFPFYVIALARYPQC